MSEEDLRGQEVSEVADQPVATDAADADLARELTQEQVAQARQANQQRKWLFRIANGLAGAAVLTSIGLVIAVLLGAQIPAAVAIAFISGLTVQTLGILAIVARYLYPPEH